MFKKTWLNQNGFIPKPIAYARGVDGFGLASTRYYQSIAGAVDE